MKVDGDNAKEMLGKKIFQKTIAEVMFGNGYIIFLFEDGTELTLYANNIHGEYFENYKFKGLVE